MDMTGLFSVLVRFLHLGSAAGIVGGILYARLAATPALNTIPEPGRAAAAQLAQAKFRGILFTMLFLSVASGLYNGFGPGAPHHTPQWHMWFGIKMLLVLHILATSILWATSPYGDVAVEGKGKRRLASLVIVGFATILIGNYLRYLTAHNL
jgi:hypothetical protein